VNQDDLYDIDGKPIAREDLPELPSWLLKAIPEPEPPLTIDAGDSPEGVLLFFPGGAEVKCSSLLEAQKVFDESELRLKFTDELLAREESNKNTLGRAIFVKLPSGNSRILTEDYDAGEILDLRESYYISLQAIERFLANPNDYLLAWDFINKHPAFWLNNNIERFPYHWETDNGTKQISQYVYSHEGETVIRLEIGGHIEPEYKHTYGDYRLHPRGKTHEEALLNLAKRVHFVFNEDGTDRGTSIDTVDVLEKLKKNIDRFNQKENHE